MLKEVCKVPLKVLKFTSSSLDGGHTRKKEHHNWILGHLAQQNGLERLCKNAKNLDIILE